MSAYDAVLDARELLETLTPLKTDCGRLCGGACCQGDEGTGMLLFPGEEAFYENCAFARIIPADFSLGGEKAKLFVCGGTCERSNRPLACRLFPLFLKFKEEGVTKLRMDVRAKAVCPLTDYGIKALDPDFKQAARKAYDRLLEDETCAAYLKDLDEAFSL
ncbi:MAG: hypothetical protein E7321_03750 [Clostridiales bacterium]|nr:hypothetical protein [Clostridiales bacterium]